MLAAQKAKAQPGVSDNVAPANLRNDANEDAEAGASGTDHDSVESEQLDAETARVGSESQAPGTSGSGDSGTKPAASVGGLAFLKRVNNNVAISGANPGGNDGAGIRGDIVGHDDVGGLGSTDFSLDDLAGLDESSTPALVTGSGFPDEIEATAPDRDLSPDLEAGQLGFIESLDNIYQVLNDPEMFGQSVRLIMMELQENPEYIKLISDQDVHTMIAAMRNTMGLARIKKQAKSRTAKNTTAAKKKGSIDDSTMAVLDALGGDYD